MARSIGKTVEDIWKGKTAPQMRLGGWLWQQRAGFDAPTDRSEVFLAVPLVSRRRATDWAMVERNLARTLAAFRAQTDTRWRAVVCGQDQPDPGLFDDRVTFLPFSGSDKFYDKGDKRVALVRHIARSFPGDGYYMQHDADDILHPRVVEHVLTDNNGCGYLIDSGYMADVAAGLFARLAPPAVTQGGTVAFNHFCGSANLIRVDFRSAPRASVRLLMKMKAHGRIPGTMALHGMPLTPIPFPAGLYLVNHGENMVQRRGNLGGKLEFLQQHLVPPDEVARIRADFGLATLPSFETLGEANGAASSSAAGT